MRRRFESREQSATEQLARLLHWNDGPHNVDEVELSDLTERVIQELSEYDYESELPISLRGIVSDYLGDRTARRVSRRRAVKGREARNEVVDYSQYKGQFTDLSNAEVASLIVDEMVAEFGQDAVYEYLLGGDAYNTDIEDFYLGLELKYDVFDFYHHLEKDMETRRSARRGSVRKRATTTDDLVKWASEFGYVITRVDPNYGGQVYMQPDGRFGDYGVDVYRAFGGEFLVQTTSWGTLTSRDIDTVIESYESAKHFADLLNTVDVESLSPYHIGG